jgi:hypothetical protein
MYRVVRLALLPACGLWLVACAASDFAGPVTAFSDTTAQAANSFKSSRESVEKFATERRLKLFNAGGALQPQTNKDCTPNGSECRLVVVDTSGSTKPVEVSLDNLQALMDDLGDYTKNLAAIVNASTSADVAKGTAAVKTSLTTLAQDADSVAKQQHLGDIGIARVSPFISPVSDAANFVISRALEAQKIAALRESTAQMEEMFPSLTRVFEAVSTAAIRQQRRQLDAAFRKASDDFRHNKSDANRDAYIRAAKAYDAALKSDPKKMYESLREAHHVLAQALNEPNPTLADLWTLLQRASDEAVKLAEISKALQKAAAAKQT